MSVFMVVGCFRFCVWTASSRGLVGAGGCGEYGIGHVCLERSRQRQKINMEENCFLLSLPLGAQQ